MRKCPYCDRDFKSFFEYPKVFINSFDRIELPELIPHNNSKIVFGRMNKGILFFNWCVDNPKIPKDVLSNLRLGSWNYKTVYNGEIYQVVAPNTDMYEVSKDITEIAKSAVRDGKISGALNKLEGLVGEETSPELILRLPGFKENTGYGGYNDLKLNIIDGSSYLKTADDNCIVVLEGDIKAEGHIGVQEISSVGIRVDLATIKYEGRVIEG